MFELQINNQYGNVQATLLFNDPNKAHGISVNLMAAAGYPSECIRIDDDHGCSVYVYMQFNWTISVLDVRMIRPRMDAIVAVRDNSVSNQGGTA